MTAAGRRAACLLGLAALAGCAPVLGSLREKGLPARARLEGVRAFTQTEHFCGPSALASLLSWAGSPETPESLGPLVYAPVRRGTLPVELSREIRSRGLLAYRVRPEPGDLLGEVAAGHPALVLENRGLSWVPLWHYSVVVGFDLDEGAATLLAGAAEPEVVALSTFARAWRRAGSFALLALPPGRLPAAEDPEGILAALADLEEVGRPEAAAPGYEALLRRWPESWRGAFGWGNALHALGQDVRAEDAFRRAHGAAPERPEPLNNLALLALAAGRRPEGEALARQAVERAGRLGLDPAPYEDTLRQALAPSP